MPAALAAALAAVDGVEIVPDPPQTPMFHVLLRGDRERLSDAALTIAEQRKVFLFGDRSPTTSPSVQLPRGERRRAHARCSTRTRWRRCTPRSSPPADSPCTEHSRDIPDAAAAHPADDGGMHTNTTLASLPAVAVLALSLAGCGAGGAEEPSSAHPATPAPTSAPASTTDPAPAKDPAIVAWKRRWRLKVGMPMLHAAATLEANATAAVNGDSLAMYRLTPAFDRLSNCRLPMETPPLSRAAPGLGHARNETLAACRELYVAVDSVIRGLNAQSGSEVEAGVARVKHAEAHMHRVGLLVMRAPTTD